MNFVSKSNVSFYIFFEMYKEYLIKFNDIHNALMPAILINET